MQTKDLLQELDNEKVKVLFALEFFFLSIYLYLFQYMLVFIGYYPDFTSEVVSPVLFWNGFFKKFQKSIYAAEEPVITLKLNSEIIF